MTVALLAAIMAVTLPLVLSQTSRLTYDEVLNQIERRAAVIRADAQRRSEPVWFEARFLEAEGVWALGTRSMRSEDGTGAIDSEELSAALLGDLETSMADDIMDQPQMFADEPDTMSGFEVVTRLPRGFSFLRTLPPELLDLKDQGAEVDEDNADIEASTLIQDEEFLDPDAGPAFGEEAPTRVLMAVFLPDGTLIGPEKIYLQGPEKRLATISMSRWLGSVRCETLTLSNLLKPTETGEESTDEPGDQTPPDPTAAEPAGEADEVGP